METMIQIQQMTLAEKIGLMETIWNNLDNSEPQFSPPEWHLEVLKIRKERILSGEIRFTDWEIAKKEIRDRLA